MNLILLVSDNSRALELLEDELTWNGLQSIKSTNLKDALTQAKGSIPDLIVVSTSNTEKEIEVFGKQIKMEYLRKKLLPGFIGLEDYLNIQTREHLIIRGILRNKVFVNNEILFLFFKMN